MVCNDRSANDGGSPWFNEPLFILRICKYRTHVVRPQRQRRERFLDLENQGNSDSPGRRRVAMLRHYSAVCISSFHLSITTRSSLERRWLTSDDD